MLGADATVYTIGSGGQYSDLGDAITAIPDSAGDIVFSFVSNLYDDYDDRDFVLPADKGIHSLTIRNGTDNTAVQVGKAGFSFFSLFSNGIPTTIESGVEIGGVIYGGALDADLTADTHIVVAEGATVTSVCGGCRNGNLTGDTNIKIAGTVTVRVIGGGQAAADESHSAVTANVSGSTNIEVTEQGCVARSIYGGGLAAAQGYDTEVWRAEASVAGSTFIQINGKVSDSPVAGVYGGGSAVYSSSNENAILTANVGTNTSIIFGAKAQSVSTYAYDRMMVVGGGIAEAAKNKTNAYTADVYGNTYIEALEDDNAAYGQPDNRAFSRFFGGGYSLYPNAQANVYGSTHIRSARPCWESNFGMIGGGGALHGGTANVKENCKVEIFGIPGQVSYYENINLVAGGGFAESFEASGATANVGSSEVIIHSGTHMETGGYTNVLGGGLAKGDQSSANVQGAVAITIEDGVAMPSGLIGGGMVHDGTNGASADVGTVSVAIGDNVTSDSYVIGGGTIKSNTVNGSAKCGSISMEIGSGLQMNDWLIAGSVLWGAGNAEVGKNDGNPAIKVHVADDMKWGGDYVFIGGSHLSGVQEPSSTADILGDIEIRIGGGTVPWYFGGSYLSNSTGSAKVKGDIYNYLTDTTVTKVFAGGGKGSTIADKEPGRADIEGKVETSFVRGIIPENPNVGGRTYSDVSGDARLTLDGTTISQINQTSSNPGKVKGTTVYQLLGEINCDNYFYHDHDEGRVLIEIGDGNGTQSQVSFTGIFSWETGMDTDLLVHKGAQLILSQPGNEAPYYLMGVDDVAIEEGGHLVVPNCGVSTEITGDLTGGGTLEMTAGGGIKEAAAGDGLYNGNLKLELNGELAEDLVFLDFPEDSTGKAVYANPKDDLWLVKENSADRSLWKLKKSGITITDPEHGTIILEGYTEGQWAFSFEPEYGYRLQDVQLGGISIMAQVELPEGKRTGRWLADADASGVLTATLVPIEKEDIQQEIQGLPVITDPDTADPSAVDAILDAKLDYETMDTEQKTELEEETVEALHNALGQLPSVEVETASDPDDKVEVSKENENRFLQALDKADIQAIKDSSAGLIKVKVTISKVENPTPEEQEKIQECLGDYQTGQHYDIKVKKQIYENSTDPAPKATQEVRQLKVPVALVFTVPDELLAQDRSYAVLRTHTGEDGTITAEILNDMDAVKETVTVRSGAFSIYTLVYKEKQNTDGPSVPSACCQVRYDAKGGSPQPEEQSVPRNTKLTQPKTPVREGYVFGGWYRDEECTMSWDFEKDQVIESMTLYAKWTEQTPGTAGPGPVTVSVVQKTQSQVKISWTPAEGADGYTVWTREEGETSYTRRAVRTGDENLTYTWKNRKPGTKHYFVVKAWIGSKETGYQFGEASKTVRGTTKPLTAKIKAVTVNSNHDLKVILEGAAAGADRYAMCYSYRPDFERYKIGVRTRYTVRTMEKNARPGTYYVKVRSYRQLENSRVYGDWSRAVQVVVEK